MATFRGNVMQECLGSVYVQPAGDVPPTETLFIMEHPTLGILLSDRDGVAVNPKSQRTGWHNKRGSSVYTLVCEDGVSDETRNRLVEAGYQNVIERP